MSFALKLNIVPDVDTIHSFANETTHEPYTITGTVELELLRPIHIRQLVIGFKGHVDCAISSADFFQDYANKDGDELPYSKWNTAQPKGWVDTLTRKAMGEANATWTIIKKQVTLMQEQQLSIGKSSWPFSITIDNVDALPPSIFIPHHTIQYQLFAQIKLNSIAERIKVSYWQAMTRLFGHLPITTATTTISVPTALTRTSSNTDSLLFSTMEHTRINTTRHLLGTSTPIQVYRHSYPSLYSLYQIQRVRYRGCRTDHIDYEVSMSKFACLQKKQFGFTCRFMPLCPDATLASIEYYLEQTETYPIRAGEFQQASITFCDSMVPRYRKYSRTFQEMSHYEPGTELGK
ncbi:hypothetical protein CU098_001857 [Rhizopus stolonifer]|uniref:Arrestin-like N-terminal domain-containing protein n=1 Tax=Rhizopus stolonifer TaxID=4846 RepID=A0A367KQK2_RHIST|nr:hypothetical protein CU098_001857 [Rhizopus stolonifer]